MVRRGWTAFVPALLLIAAGCSDGSPVVVPSSPPPSASPEAPTPTALPARFHVVGHEPLASRGMNAALAVHDRYAYIGNRTDGSAGHPRPGVLVVDVSAPAKPRVVGEIASPPLAAPGSSSRELRVWHRAELLFVLNIPCSPALHRCAASRTSASVTIYDISGTAAAAPRLVSTYRPSKTPHEFFLWTDPKDQDRAVLYLSTPGGGSAELIVAEVSRRAEVKEVATWRETFPDRGPDDTLHSVSVSPDGTRAYLAHLTAGFLIADTSRVAAGDASPVITTVTAVRSRPQWPGRGAHSAVKVPGRTLAVTTDEAYGAEEPGGGCPFGWMRILDIADQARPQVVSEVKVPPYNVAESCAEVPESRNREVSYSTHNPTVTANLALVSWHAAGLQAVSIADPARPARVAEFVPTPLPTVATEDPALTGGTIKVAMWSYPIVKDGLIYVVDVRNGLFVLRYEGPHQDEIRTAVFLEGNGTGG